MAINGTVAEDVLTIYSFRGSHLFLSNFYSSTITTPDGLYWPTVEHAFQGSKTTDPATRERIRKCITPAEAKRIGRRAPLRGDWEQVKIKVMRDLVYLKFTQHPDLAKKLQDTMGYELVERNSWGDRFWGVCKGLGENHLGKILMDVREELAGTKN